MQTVALARRESRRPSAARPGPAPVSKRPQGGSFARSSGRRELRYAFVDLILCARSSLGGGGLFSGPPDTCTGLPQRGPPPPPNTVLIGRTLSACAPEDFAGLYYSGRCAQAH